MSMTRDRGGRFALLLLAATLGLCGLGHARGSACDWRASPPDSAGARHTFRVACSAPGTSYGWDFGDGQKAVTDGPTVGHAYAAPGDYFIEVRIAMPQGDTQVVWGRQTAYRPSAPGRSRGSASILFDSAASRIWTVNPDNHSVVFIEWPSRRRSREIPVGRKPRTLALDGRGAVWVCSQEDATLSILDAGTGGLLRTLALPRASQPFGVAIDPVRAAVYVTLQATGRLLKFDAGDKRLLGDLEVTPSARGLAVSADGGRILVTRFVSGPEAGEIVEVDAAAFTVARRYPLALDPGPDTEVSGSGIPNAVNAVAFSPDGREAWFTAKKDNVGRGLFRDGRTFTEENTVRTFVGSLDLAAGAEAVAWRRDLDNRSMAKALAFSHDGIFAFAATEGSNSVEIFNVPGRRQIGTLFPLRPDQEHAPQGLAVHPGDSLLFVQYFTSREVGVYDITPQDGFIPFVRVDMIKTVDTDSLGPLEARGQEVFYNSADHRMNRSDYLSCSACHMDGGGDGRVWDFTERGEGLRNTATLLGKGGPGAGPFHWTANFDEIQDFEHDIRGHHKGAGFLADEVFAQGTRGSPLGDPKAGLSGDLDALSAFLYSLSQAPPSPYRAPDGGLTPGARRGREVFRREGTGCALCHSGPRFTDSGLRPGGDPAALYAPFHAVAARPGGFVLHDVGTLRPSSGKRLADTLEGLDTPTLEGIWATAPFLHDGSAATLHEVIGARNAGDRHGRTGALSPQEKADLVEYLLQIDGTPEETSRARPARGDFGRLAARARPGGRILFTVPGGGPRPSEVTLYDGQGRRRARFGGAGEWRASPRGWELAWDGRGPSGGPLPGGLYWARLSAAPSAPADRWRSLPLVLGESP